MIPEHAQLGWQDGQPLSLKYQDVYFSSANGLQETQHVFLEHNRLSQRWAALTSEHFTIAETGFGIGLNFLCAWRLWNEQAPASGRLHFISTEKYLLTPSDLAQALALWPQLQQERDQLLAQYRELSPGWHRLVFEQGRIVLTLLIGDIHDTLPQLKAGVDAWFLDGFAPARNPEMWQPALFSQMARLSRAAATFATFTSAGAVKRGLQAVGFEVRKVPGFGRKREMLYGHYVGLPPGSAARKSAGPQCSAPARQAIVIGGGIAGAASSNALANRGWQVTLIERHAAIASEASGNAVGILYPRLSGQDIVLSRLAQHGYLHTLRLLQRLRLDTAQHTACGLLQLAFNAKEALRCEAVAARGLPTSMVRYVDADEAGALAGIDLGCGGLYFPSAGWVNPPALCRQLALHPNIGIRLSSEALTLQRRDNVWEVHDAQSLIAAAPVVIIAAANASASFSQTAHLPLQAVRGQLSFIAETPASSSLQAVVCTDGYLSPAINGWHCLGATYTPDDHSAAIRRHDHLANLALLKHLSPALYAASAEQSMQGRVAFRCVTPDYLPMAGPVLDHAALAAGTPRPHADPASLPWLHGLYVNIGHGSKGLINAPFCAEILASAIAGEPLPADMKLLAALDPNRFLLRKLGLKKLVQGLAAYPLL